LFIHYGSFPFLASFRFLCLVFSNSKILCFGVLRFAVSSLFKSYLFYSMVLFVFLGIIGVFCICCLIYFIISEKFSVITSLNISGSSFSVSHLEFQIHTSDTIYDCFSAVGCCVPFPLCFFFQLSFQYWLLFKFADIFLGFLYFIEKSN
jgi:hypothetical protein